MNSFPPFAELLPPDFLSSMWGRRHHLEAPNPKLVDCFVQRLGPLDFRAIAARSTRVQGWFTSDLGFSAIALDVEAVQGAYATGATLHFNDIDLADCVGSCARFLGAQPSKVIANLFATPAGGRVARHFDANENFTIQLAGKKRWYVAPCRDFIEPPVNHVEGTAVSEQLEFARRPSLDGEGIEACVDLVPGSLLYVPRGFWHATEAMEDSLSVNLCYGKAMWVDVLCEALYAHLLKQPAWRATALGYCGHGLPGELTDLLSLLSLQGTDVHRLLSRFND